MDLKNQPDRLGSECLLCIAGKLCAAYPPESTEQQRLQYIQNVYSIMAAAPATDAAPVVVDHINNMREEMFGDRVSYSSVKHHFNELMLSREEKVRGDIEAAPDPLARAIQYALIGNYIDFGAQSDVSEETLEEQFEAARSKTFDRDAYEKLQKDLESKRTLLYLTDNCGEIVLDKLLIEQLLKQFPRLEVTVMVRGEEVLNDVTMEDAVQTGLDKMSRVRVMDNGNRIAGTWLPSMPEEALKVLEESDIILAKGQGNYETMNGCGLNVYYLFLCKCDMYVRLFGVPRLTGMLIREMEHRIQDHQGGLS